MLIKELLKGYRNRVYRTAAGLWALGHVVPRHRNVLLLLGREDDPAPELHLAHNIVTDAGDVYYAQKITGEAVTNDFTSLYLSTVDWNASHPAKGTTTDNLASVIAGSEKAVAATYPKRNDADADNTGAGVDVVTWKFTYAKADFADADIDAGAISLAGVTSWGAGAGSDAILTGFDLTAFGKTTNDTLTVYVNHQQNGV